MKARVSMTVATRQPAANPSQEDAKSSSTGRPEGMMRTVGLLCVAVAGALAPASGWARMTAEERIRALEESIRRQQQEIRELRREINEQKTSGTLTRQQAQKAEEKATALETAAKAIPKWVERISLFGDVRIRHEGFYNQPTEQGTPVGARNRERLRARIGATFRYSDELSATIRLASGNPDDPISTNQTFTDEFTRKPISLDWAYVTFAPGKTFGIRPGLISLTGGKFAVPQFRVGELVFDDDLSVEGFSEVFQVLPQKVGPLDQIRIFVEQWSFNEASNEQDGWVFGGQVNPVGQVGPVQVEAGVAQWWYLNPDFIAQALNTNDALFNTNLVITEDDMIVAYRSGFNLTNVTLQATLPNVVYQMPLRFFFDYVHNWQAATTQSNGVQLGAKLGQTKVRGDWAVAALWEHLEQEATVSSFTWSDFGFGGTNVQGPVFQADYQLLDPLTLTAKTFFVNYLTAPTNTTNPTLIRLQLDAQVRF
jgi:uncharacterized coiled-coil protein SlyX